MKNIYGTETILIEQCTQGEKACTETLLPVVLLFDRVVVIVTVLRA